MEAGMADHPGLGAQHDRSDEPLVRGGLAAHLIRAESEEARVVLVGPVARNGGTEQALGLGAIREERVGKLSRDPAELEPFGSDGRDA
jgi:hypothetical protein